MYSGLLVAHTEILWNQVLCVCKIVLLISIPEKTQSILSVHTKDEFSHCLSLWYLPRDSGLSADVTGGLNNWPNFTESHSLLNYKLGRFMFTYLLKYYMDQLTEEEHIFWSPTVSILSSCCLVLDYFYLEGIFALYLPRLLISPSFFFFITLILRKVQFTQ